MQDRARPVGTFDTAIRQLRSREGERANVVGHVNNIRLRGAGERYHGGETLKWHKNAYFLANTSLILWVS
jgi:hypothetical protein